MAWGRTRTKHAGAKHGKGHWGKKADAKQASKRCRRCEDRLVVARQDEGSVQDDAAFVREAARRILSAGDW